MEENNTEKSTAETQNTERIPEQDTEQAVQDTEQTAVKDGEKKLFGRYRKEKENSEKCSSAKRDGELMIGGAAIAAGGILLFSLFTGAFGNCGASRRVCTYRTGNGHGTCVTEDLEQMPTVVSDDYASGYSDGTTDGYSRGYGDGYEAGYLDGSAHGTDIYGGFKDGDLGTDTEQSAIQGNSSDTAQHNVLTQPEEKTQAESRSSD